MGDVGYSLPEPSSADLAPLLARFHEKLKGLEVAVREWGCLPHHPEGVFISAMMDTQRVFVEVAVQLSRGIEGTVREARAFSEAELARQRVVTEGTQRAMETARAVTENLKNGSKIALASFEAEKQKVTTDFVKNLIPEIVIGLKNAMVLRQHHYDRDKEWGRAMGTGCLMLGLLVGGYVIGSFADGGRGMRLEKLEALIERCQLASPWKDDKGHRLCVIDEFKKS